MSSLMPSTAMRMARSPLKSCMASEVLGQMLVLGAHHVDRSTALPVHARQDEDRGRLHLGAHGALTIH